jgi:16S rRNA (uracil1498-N3)-methyltransferase
LSARFFCPDSPREGRQHLGPDEAHHLSRVSRLGKGAIVEVFDGKGLATRSEVVAIDRERVELEILSVLPRRLPPLRLTLATAVPKGERFDWLVEKATELGVERLIPITSARSVVEPSEAKLWRLRRSIVEACKQCRRDCLMILDPPADWASLVEATLAPTSCRLLADPEGRKPPSWPAIKRGQGLTLAVGPEGGFEPAERELAIRAGWSVVCLGVNILRIETAAIAGSAALLAGWQEANE